MDTVIDKRAKKISAAACKFYCVAGKNLGGAVGFSNALSQMAEGGCSKSLKLCNPLNPSF
jgi:hypothetical protein